MKYTTETFNCDECKTGTGKDIPYKCINIITPETEYDPKDFCSLNCFLKYFNTKMSEEKLDIRIAQGDDD